MQKYGLIGYPLGHSFSRNYFNQKFESENIDAQYLNFEIPSIKDFKEVLKENPELNGLNVTIPYKEQVIPYLDDLDEDARQIGAVNVIKFKKGMFGKTKLIGYNSDVIGFKQSIEPLLTETHRKALVLGTGGASKAVSYGLKQLGIEPTLVSACSPMWMLARTSRMLASRLSTSSTIYSTTQIRRSSCARDRNMARSSRTGWKCCFSRHLPLGEFGKTHNLVIG